MCRSLGFGDFGNTSTANYVHRHPEVESEHEYITERDYLMLEFKMRKSRTDFVLIRDPRVSLIE